MRVVAKGARPARHRARGAAGACRHRGVGVAAAVQEIVGVGGVGQRPVGSDRYLSAPMTKTGRVLVLDALSMPLTQRSNQRSWRPSRSMA